MLPDEPHPAPRSGAAVRFETTPNPNALKCVPAFEITGGLRSYRARPAAPTGDALADALFAIPGVAGLLITPQWVAVNKTAEEEWARLRPEISRVLRAARSGA